MTVCFYCKLAVSWHVSSLLLVCAVWDLGGQTSIRPYWRCYYANTDAIIYVVDSVDRDRLAISKSELVSMLEVSSRPTHDKYASLLLAWGIYLFDLCLQEDELKTAMLMVFANKQDIEGAMTPSEISNALGLSALKNRTWAIFKTSAIKGEGLEEAMEWYIHC